MTLTFVSSRLSLSNHFVTFAIEYLGNRFIETEAWFQRTTNRKWHMGYQMVT